MKQFLKNILRSAGYSVQKLPPGQATGADLGRDLGIVVGGRKGPCCIDVGANHGDMVTLMQRSLNSPSVHAFEPNPESFAALQRNHGATPQVFLNHAGLGDQRGTLTLQLLQNHALNSFLPLSETGRVRLDATDQPKAVEVAVVRLDDYATEKSLNHIDLLKIDTQGYELHVLRGAKGLFTAGRVQAVLVELDFADLYVGQAAPSEVMSLLQAHGLRLVDFYEKARHHQALSWCTALFAKTGATRP